MGVAENFLMQAECIKVSVYPTLSLPLCNTGTANPPEGPT